VEYPIEINSLQFQEEKQDNYIKMDLKEMDCEDGWDVDETGSGYSV
jgi:hypothetical protein